MTLSLNDKLAVLDKGGRLRRSGVIFKCGILRGKKEDDSVGRWVPGPEQMRRHFVWAGGSVYEGRLGGQNHHVFCRFPQHISGSTCNRPLWSLYSLPLACGYGLLMPVCVSFHQVQFKSSFCSVLRGIADTQMQMHHTLLRTWALLLPRPHPHPPLFLSTLISALKRAAR